MQALNIPGFEGQAISAKVSSGFQPSKLFLNGHPAPPAPKKNQYLLRRNDGTEVTAFFKAGFPDPVPVLMVGHQKVPLAPPLPGYVWAWAAFPLALIFLGGFFGALMGVTATTFNSRVFRSERPLALKFILTGVINAAVFTLWILLALSTRR